ncbi:MAG: hypothetical protein JWO00_422 [Candidatus Parcubacteria bacterium]|nr:hypothetical protein [Candidatus Parcubacteria bacterium]
MELINAYLHFKVGAAVCSVPYFNNKTLRSRGALNALVGKGSPKEILDEAETLVFKNHIKLDAFADESLKKILVDNNIGIDCSALAFYVLDTESQAQDRGPLKKHLEFIHAHGIKGFVASRSHPCRLTDVETFASDLNSRPVELHEVAVADMITMMDGSDTGERNHILVIHQIDSTDGVPTKLHYSHAVAYPEDGLYGSGVKQGVIEISKPGEPLLSQRWIENGLEGADNRIFARAQRSKTQLRRLKW